MPEQTNALPQGFVQQTGYIAFQNGWLLEDNPYSMWECYEKFYDWQSGWQTAFAAENN